MEFDVAVVGASVAGCTAARLFAQSSATVALSERRQDLAAYKVVCTHAILPSATPTLERLGLAPVLTERGAARTQFELAARPGIAFVGDAALATDPALGVGIGFAFQSAEWLVDDTSSALGGGPELDHALRRYRRKLLSRLGPQHRLIADFSTGRNFRPLERLALRKATVDPELARALGEVLVRERSPFRLLDPRLAARLVIPRRTPTSGSAVRQEKPLVSMEMHE